MRFCARAAWFNGYTPQLSTSVGLWRTSKDGKQSLSLRNLPGYSQVYGGTIPAKIWRDYMATALEGKEVKQFPPPQNVGDSQVWATPPPTHTQSPRPTRSPSARPTQTHTAEPTTEPTPSEPQFPTPGQPTDPGPQPSKSCGLMDPTCNNKNDNQGNNREP